MEHNVLGHLSSNLEPFSCDLPFNEVDGMVFALFAYMPAGRDIRTYKGDTQINPVGLSIGEFASMLISTEYSHILKARFGKNMSGEFGLNINFLKAIALNNRYKDVIIANFSYNNEGVCQFSAYTLAIYQNEYIIAYRGTDGTFEGWYESFKMLNENIPGQLLASEYFNNELKQRKGSYYLIGHSKGGHLAMAAAITAKVKQKLSIKKVISYDGPGFTYKFLTKNRKNILLIQHKTYSYAAENAVISNLLYGQNELFFAENKHFLKPHGLQSAVNQHFCFNWLVEESSFVESSQSKFSMVLAAKLLDVSKSYSNDVVAQVCDEVFEAIGKEINYSEKNVSIFDIINILIAGQKKLSEKVKPKKTISLDKSKSTLISP